MPEDGQSILFQNIKSKPVLFRTTHPQERVVPHSVTKINAYHNKQREIVELLVVVVVRVLFLSSDSEPLCFSLSIKL